MIAIQRQVWTARTAANLVDSLRRLGVILNYDEDADQIDVIIPSDVKRNHALDDQIKLLHFYGCSARTLLRGDITLGMQYNSICGIQLLVAKGAQEAEFVGAVRTNR